MRLFTCIDIKIDDDAAIDRELRCEILNSDECSRNLSIISIQEHEKLLCVYTILLTNFTTIS